MKFIPKTLFTLSICLLLVSCQKNRTAEGSMAVRTNIKYAVTASVETTPMAQPFDVDAADDPAFWRHPNDVSKSIIIGTDKKSGLAVYNLDGELITFYKCGEMNNVDVRYNFISGGDTFDIAAASNRITNTIDVFKIDSKDGSLTEVTDSPITSLVNNVYGFCLYKSPVNERTYAFVNSKYGEVEQWLLKGTDSGKINGELVRSFSVNTQVEGMVTDDTHGWLFLGEERSGIFRFNAEPDTIASSGLKIAKSDSTNEAIVYDIEGLAIYATSDTSGYLLASSQGNFTYAVFNRMPPNEYLGSFYIKDGLIDGVDETDGIELVNIPINKHFPKGMLIAQDGINKHFFRAESQNFKYIDWRKIERVIKKFTTTQD